MRKQSSSDSDRSLELRSSIRPHVEQSSPYKEELAALREEDRYPKPKGWFLSPRFTLLYILGGVTPKGKVITRKYIGDEQIVKNAIAILASNNALLLVGDPGTGKSLLSEHLAAAVSGDSSMIVQGTSGTEETALRYGWNYSILLSDGFCKKALVESPVMRAMRLGKIVRVEELTRIGSDVQDALITILSEKLLPVPELSSEVQAQDGFNVIATANSRDRGVNEFSSALARRFMPVIVPPPATFEDEVAIVLKEVKLDLFGLDAKATERADAELRRVVTIFRELRSGATLDGTMKLKSPTATLSTAEEISIMSNGLANAVYFGSGVLTAADLARSLVAAIVRDPAIDKDIMREYRRMVMKNRDGWKDLYDACEDLDS